MTLLAEICTVGAWRSLVLIGTSIPTMMSEVTQGTVGSIPRREWELWSKLRERELGRMPAFGDYAVQHPDPPLDGGGPGMRANIRYTVAEQTLVARGMGPFTQEGKEQYQDLCAWLVEAAGVRRRRLQLGRFDDRQVRGRADRAGGAGHVARRRDVTSPSRRHRAAGRAAGFVPKRRVGIFA